jgi:MPBQ/MSBQ methyltransferase
MDVRDLVTDHYGAKNLSERIVHALSEAGIDSDRLGAHDLFAVDQLHAGGPMAIRHLLERLEIGPGTRLLDVGCGIGGTSRMAAMAGAEVTGVDLTPEFVEAATILTKRVGLANRATFLTTPGESLALPDASFDVAVMVHVGMNIPDKQAVFAEVHRVLAPGGRFGIYDQMRTRDGDLTYPLPWAEDERSSFVETAADYTRELEAAGFTVDEVEDRTASTMGGPPPGPVSNAVIFGPEFVRRIGNNITATKAGRLGAMLVLART